MSYYFRKDFTTDRRIDESQAHINRELDAEFRRIQALGLALAILKSVDHKPPLFELGMIAATPGAVDLLDRTGRNASDFLMLHVTGNYGDVSYDDGERNDRAITNQEQVFSKYLVGPRRETLLICTEYDRSETVLILPEER